tara:strand:- start:451 stop:621 length:171 start_codon:yes stop_codon:yes gene_type:complete
MDVIRALQHPWLSTIATDLEVTDTGIIFHKIMKKNMQCKKMVASKNYFEGKVDCIS